MELVLPAEPGHRPVWVADLYMPPDYTARRTGDPPHHAVHPDRRVVPAPGVPGGAELVTGHPGRVGSLLKQRIADVITFCADLRRVQAGGTVLDPEVVALMVARARTARAGLRQLTARQQQVLALMAEGRSNAFIARTLSLTERSVVQHASNIYAQLGLAPSDDDHRRVLAVVSYLSQ
jgi:DNA-binding CsgD family transcriptional regulator